MKLSNMINVNIDLSGVIVGGLSIAQSVVHYDTFFLILTIVVCIVMIVLASCFKFVHQKNRIPKKLSDNIRVPILIIDDDINHLLVMKRKFEGNSYDIALSRSLDDIRITESFAIIVSDIMGVSLPLSGDKANNHSKVILEKIEKEHPYKKIIRVSQRPSSDGSSVICKDQHYQDLVLKNVNEAIDQMKNPRQYWEAISSDLKNRGVGVVEIRNIKNRFANFCIGRLR